MGENPISGNVPTEEKEDKIKQAALWNKKGEGYFNNKEYSKAIEAVLKAVELHPAEMKYVVNLALTYRMAEKFDEAEKALKKGLSGFTKEKDQKEFQNQLADVYYNWAKNFEKKKDHANAIKYYETAYTIVKIYSPQKVPIALENIGNLYRNLGQNQKALEYFEKALPISQALGDRHGEGIILNRIGKVYSALGQNQKAIGYYEKALPIMQEVKDRSREAKTLNAIGLLYSTLGQKKRALEYYEIALLIHHPPWFDV
jgi:tetratricopeptide (TPR) repeat protein